MATVYDVPADISCEVQYIMGYIEELKQLNKDLTSDLELAYGRIKELKKDIQLISENK